MAKFEIVMPKLGESIIEATITKWLKKEGDPIKEDESILEIATDKVDSEIPSPVEGILLKRLFNEGDVVSIGTVIAVIDLGGDDLAGETQGTEKSKTVPEGQTSASVSVKEKAQPADVKAPETLPKVAPVDTEENKSGRFYSPLVKNIAKQENISMQELEHIPGSGSEGRLTKQDLLDYVASRGKGIKQEISVYKPEPVAFTGEDQVVEMDRIRQLISGHMVKSVQTSPHVTSFIEVDMTRIVNWREKHKDEFLKRQGMKLTFTPIFIEAIAKAVRDYPQVNVSVDGTSIVYHKNINVGMAVSLPNFNLIVPVIRNADQKNLFGILRDVIDLADRARSSKLKPDEIGGGTISLTNLGSFGTLAGTPIINQPQTAIVAVGSIKKRPVVIETPDGDVIAIRHMMILSITFDHRVIDGALGGQFLNKMVSYLENFDTNQNI
ncbi:MAG: dihydrolipoamide acetyltransferase family protein [Bacteroidales bacterium]|jgi:2-oxoglutarate dehydrogenase E2 component (dihydrolipoamide succinyltransferase)